jgi:hypothetical protein
MEEEERGRERERGLMGVREENRCDLDKNANQKSKEKVLKSTGSASKNKPKNNDEEMRRNNENWYESMTVLDWHLGGTEGRAEEKRSGREG